MAQTLMEIMETKVVRQDNSTGLLPFAERSRADQLLATEILTLAECRELRAWAHNQPPTPSVTPEEFARHFDFIASTLPSKFSDAHAAKQKFAVFYRLLSSYSNEAIAYLARRACAELDWQPTPNQCFAILKDFVPSKTEAQQAVAKCEHSAAVLFGQFCDALKAGPVEQSFIDAVPEQWQRMADCQNLVRWRDGKWVQRQAAYAKPERIEAQ